jgi:hypothetical protein
VGLWRIRAPPRVQFIIMGSDAVITPRRDSFKVSGYFLQGLEPTWVEDFGKSQQLTLDKILARVLNQTIWERKCKKIDQKYVVALQWQGVQFALGRLFVC